MEFANRMRPKGASDTLYIFQTPFKDLYVHLSTYTAIQFHLSRIQFYIQIFRPLNISHLGTILTNQHCILLFQKGFFGDMLRG